jgi:Flp pilus assembly pilin Flp
MKRFCRWLLNFGKREHGSMEPGQYAVALALITIAVIAGLRLLGNATSKENNATSDYLRNAATPRSSAS